jgi:FKBP-type peptidyl-prolyl cis-trans isomerase SlyD
MQISEDKVVTLGYSLSSKKDNGLEEMVEQTSPDHPFVFLFGFGGVLPDFESSLEGKQKGDKFDFKISAENAYGQYEKDYVVKIDKGAFEVDGKFDDARVKVGHDVEMTDAEGNPLTGRILSIDDKAVEMDFNHPLAGHELHFIGDILDVREATQEELDHGHVHGPHGHHH